MPRRTRLLDIARARVQRLAWRARGWPHVEQLKRRGLRVGDKAFLGTGVYLDPDFCFLIEIGERVTLSNDVTVLAHDAAGRHVIGYGRIAPVRIGDWAFVGAGVVILPGVTIGERAIVGAGSVVHRDVAPETIVAGNPAVQISDRATFAARGEQRLEQLPKFKRAGWTVSTGIDEARIEEMRAALAEHGSGYIT